MSYSSNSIFSKSFTILIFLAFMYGNLVGCKVSPTVSTTTNHRNPPKTEIPDSSTTDSLDNIISTLMTKYEVPGMSVAFLKNDDQVTARCYGLLQTGKDDRVNAETIFSVGSISKVVNAFIILRLVQDGKLDLDTDVNQYLKSWKVEENKHTEENPVTLRRILSHTAGFTVHGFADFHPDETLPTTVQILQGKSPAKNKKVYVNSDVGTKFKYSGGGITVSQLIVEELTGMTYHEAARTILFDPIGLTRTSYENPLPVEMGNIAKAHDDDGDPVALPRGYQSMPEKAASGLWTTPSELAKILHTVLAAFENDDSSFISRALLEDMISPEENTVFGLGPKMEFRDGDTIVYHGGANDSYRAHFQVFWEKKKGYIVFSNGANGSKLIGKLKPILNEYTRNKY